ncbi:MAG: hypothetical protein QXS32_09095 [Candidatus Nezhaarchaeales archaeon]
MSVLIYWLVRLLFGVSWFAYWCPFLVVVLLVSYIGLLSYFRQRILNALREAVEEDFNISKVPELLERLSETCVSDDIEGRISRKFVFSTIMFWFSYYALLVLLISITDHYTIYYGGPPISTLLFDTYAIYTLTFVISSLVISSYLAHTKYVESEKARRDVFSEWAEKLIEDYTVSNCLRGELSRILMIIVPLMPIPEIELLRPMPALSLPRSLAEKRLNAMIRSEYSIEQVEREKGQPANLVPEERKAVTVEDLEKGILQYVKMARVYKNEGNKRELLGYLITLTAKLEASKVIPTRRVKDEQFLCKPGEAMTYIYLLALHPSMAKFYMDLLTLRPRSQQEIRS